MVILTLPLGDLTADQARALADIARQYTGDTLRTTADQNLVLRWVSDGDLPAVYAALVKAKLAEAGRRHHHRHHRLPGHRHLQAGHLVVARAGGRAAPRAGRRGHRPERPRPRRCTSRPAAASTRCGQHHVADLGFLGVSRNVNGRRVPHFQLVIGGQWKHNAGAYGLAIGAIPSKRVPEFTKRITEMYAQRPPGGRELPGLRHPHRQEDHPGDGRGAAGAAQLRAGPQLLQRLGRPARIHHRRHGRGRVRRRGGALTWRWAWPPPSARSSRPSCCWTRASWQPAASRAYSAMLQAARALAREKNPNLGTEPDEVVGDFRTLLLRHPAVLRPLRRAASSRSTSSASTTTRPGPATRRPPTSHRGGPAVRRRRPPVLHPPGRHAERARSPRRPDANAMDATSCS